MIPLATKLKCNECGARAHKKVLYEKLRENPLLNKKEIQAELAKQYPNIRCLNHPDCDGRYVPADSDDRIYSGTREKQNEEDGTGQSSSRRRRGELSKYASKGDA